MEQLKIEYLPIDDLIMYANNAKEHPAQQIEQIKQSIVDNGFCDPVAIWKNNEVIEGHGRIIAAKELGINDLPVIRLDHLTDKQRKAYALIHNKLTMNSDFNLDLLNIELEGLQDMDMERFGFDLNLDDDTDTDSDRSDVAFHESVSVVIDCKSDEEAEEIFNALTEEGYICRISTL